MHKFIQGNCIDVIKTLENNSIDCVVSSPPYFGLRDYGVDGQFGLEKTYQDYLANTVKVFETFRPKLKDTATIWWNIGDSYSNHKDCKSIGQTLAKGTTREKAHEIEKGKSHTRNSKLLKASGLKDKDLMMMPNRVAIALQDAGWYIRSEIIWHKPNPMPESVKDRPTSCHEKIWLITKNKKYYYDADAIREPLKSQQSNNKNNLNVNFGKYKTDDNEKKHRQGMSKTRGSKLVETRPKIPNQKQFVSFLREKTSLKNLVENTDIKKTTIEHWFRTDSNGFAFPSILDWNKIKHLLNDGSEEFYKLDFGLTYAEYHTDEVRINQRGKNKRNVWTITTKPFKEAHFATFPKDLIEPCILAGCPEGGTVLDPFSGAGTTVLVANEHNRKAIGIELKDDYIKIAERRMNDCQPRMV